jgi:hypothetical protein
MKNFSLKTVSFLTLALCLLFTTSSNAQTVFALSGDKLVSFEASNPGVLTQSLSISGLAVGHSLMGLDFRPATGQLYALGYNSVSGAAELYTIDRNTAVATKVGNGPITLNANIVDFGFDFNPTVDRIRVTGSDNSNYRLHPVTGALAATDGNLAYAATDANAAADPNVVASAYTNSYIGATATTLYNFDAALNILVTQVPPNNGTLNTVGGSGLTLNLIDQSIDLDITYDVANSSNAAYLVANTDASFNDNLYSVNLTTGAATLIGSIGGGIVVRDIAVVIDRIVPSTVTGNLLYALNSGNNLISFDSNLPGVIRTLVAVTGVTAGQLISGLDFRPATGELYALGYNPMSGETRLYTINLMTGAATAIGTAAVTLPAGLGKIGMDFNPTVDRIRVTSSSNANYRLHPTTGAIAATDMNLAFAGTNAGVNPSIGTVAYTNSFNGAATTTLYNYDDSLNVLTTQLPPNNGTLNTIGASGISVNLADPSADLDIYYDQLTAQNSAFLAANVTAQTSDNLYSVNLTTGAATLVGKIGLGIAVTDLAAFLVALPVETACTEKTQGCARFELLSVKRDANGYETFRIRYTNNCASPLNYVAFTVPNGVQAVGPINNTTYAAPSTRPYTVRSPNYSPFYSIRFQTQGTGIATAQSDIFEYKLPKYTDLNNINAYAKLADGTSYSVYLSTYNCPTQAFSSSKDESDETTDRAENNLTGNGNMTLSPNPTAGQLLVDLSAWNEQDVTLSVISATGQKVQQIAVGMGANTYALELPASMSNGMYYLEMQAADGTRQVKRFVVLR